MKELEKFSSNLYIGINGTIGWDCTLDFKPCLCITLIKYNKYKFKESK